MREMLRCRLQRNDHSIMAVQNIGWSLRRTHGERAVFINIQPRFTS
jgi:hypothetical protein